MIKKVRTILTPQPIPTKPASIMQVEQLDQYGFCHFSTKEGAFHSPEDRLGNHDNSKALFKSTPPIDKALQESLIDRARHRRQPFQQLLAGVHHHSDK